MRILPLAVLLLALAPEALAQVSSSDQSLDALTPAPSAKKAAAAATHKATHGSKKTAHPAHAARSSASGPLAKAAPQVPAAPPAYPVIAPPPIMLPTHPPPPPPPIPLKANAVGTATAMPDGTTITFGPGASDLNPDTLAAIRAIATDAQANPAIVVAVTAWAPGTQDDPSTPRRLSLDRALAARAVLINAGIVSSRIRAIAKGMNDIGTASPDRAEIVKLLPAPTTSPPAAGQAAAPAGPPKKQLLH